MSRPTEMNVKKFVWLKTIKNKLSFIIKGNSARYYISDLSERNDTFYSGNKSIRKETDRPIAKVQT